MSEFEQTQPERCTRCMAGHGEGCLCEMRPPLWLAVLVGLAFVGSGGFMIWVIGMSLGALYRVMQ